MTEPVKSRTLVEPPLYFVWYHSVAHDVAWYHCGARVWAWLADPDPFPDPPPDDQGHRPAPPPPPPPTPADPSYLLSVLDWCRLQDQTQYAGLWATVRADVLGWLSPP